MLAPLASGRPQALLSHSPPGRLEAVSSRSVIPLASGAPQSASSLVVRRRLLTPQSRRRRRLRLARGSLVAGSSLVSPDIDAPFGSWEARPRGARSRHPPACSAASAAMLSNFTISLRKYVPSGTMDACDLGAARVMSAILA